VRRVPEVMVKVLPKDSNNLRSVGRHLDYIGRYGKLELETDDGERVQGKDAGQQLLEDWDLDLDEHRKDARLASVTGRSPKLVHKIMLSMPPGTPPKGVLEAVRNFAREEFALKHRYALVLHTDEPHPHVHLVVKAVSEQGVRLNISPATLREWRREFAKHLRQEGIAANATERAVRGETRTHKLDGIYRATLRGDSTHTRARTESVAAELLKGDLRAEPGKSKLIATRSEVERAWRATSDILTDQGHPDLAARVRQFLEGMPPPLTENEHIAAALLRHARVRSAERPWSR
jgi:Relaxase/Mobilisation nuclease domain